MKFMGHRSTVEGAEKVGNLRLPWCQKGLNLPRRGTVVPANASGLSGHCKFQELAPGNLKGGIAQGTPETVIPEIARYGDVENRLDGFRSLQSFSMKPKLKRVQGVHFGMQLRIPEETGKGFFPEGGMIFPQSTVWQQEVLPPRIECRSRSFATGPRDVLPSALSCW
jgi:hypothetical protein